MSSLTDRIKSISPGLGPVLLLGIAAAVYFLYLNEARSRQIHGELRVVRQQLVASRREEMAAYEELKDAGVTLSPDVQEADEDDGVGPGETKRIEQEMYEESLERADDEEVEAAIKHADEIEAEALGSEEVEAEGNG